MIKLFFLTAQLQGLRIVNTFPWAFLFIGKIKKKLTKFDLLSIIIYLAFLFYGLLIATDNLSALKISIFLILSILALQKSLNPNTFINTNFYLIILVGLIIEDIFIKYFAIQSPFVRDPSGAFFFFREKSYFSLFLFSIISFSRKISYKHIFWLYFIGIFTDSGLFWGFYLILILYKITRKINENLISFFFIGGLTTLYLYIENLSDWSIIYKYISYDDLLRFLINLTSWHSDCIGTLFFKQCTQTKIVLDLFSSYFIDWDNLTAQSPFFLLYNYFGYPGIFLTIFLIYLMYKKIKTHNNFGFMFFNILFQIFLQGFLLNPFFFWIMSMREDKLSEKTINNTILKNNQK